jgi:hypothetical protein
MRRLTQGNLNRRVTRLNKALETLPSDAHKEFQSITPIDTGNARRSTDIRGNEIQANYPYANRLNEGYSRQARQGMTNPTIDWIRTYLRGL